MAARTGFVTEVRNMGQSFTGTNFLWGQISYGDKLSMGTKFLRDKGFYMGQSLYGDKVYTVQC
jgi:hypothetical protein